MENNFKYISYCELVFVSETKDLTFISDELKIEPDRYFKKGDQSISKHSGSIVTKPYHLWAIKTKTTDLMTEEIKHHIHELKEILTHVQNKITRFKNDKEIQISFLIWLETDNSGISYSLNEEELLFISSISSNLKTVILRN